MTGPFVVFWVCLCGVLGGFLVFFLKGVVRDGSFRGVLGLFEGRCS